MNSKPQFIFNLAQGVKVYIYRMEKPDWPFSRPNRWLLNNSWHGLMENEKVVPIPFTNIMCIVGEQSPSSAFGEEDEHSNQETLCHATPQVLRKAWLTYLTIFEKLRRSYVTYLVKSHHTNLWKVQEYQAAKVAKKTSKNEVHHKI